MRLMNYAGRTQYTNPKRLPLLLPMTFVQGFNFVSVGVRMFPTRNLRAVPPSLPYWGC